MAIESKHVLITRRVSNNVLGAGGRAATNGEQHSFSGAFSLVDDTRANDDSALRERGAQGLLRQGRAEWQAGQ